MSAAAPRPRDTVAQIHPYTPGRSSVAAFQGPVAKLSANENALGASPRAVQGYRDALDRLHLYPDSRTEALRQALSKRHGLEPERLIFGCGSDEIFSLACQAFLESGCEMIQPRHGFAAWAIAARAVGGTVIDAPERNFHVDVDAILERVGPRTRIVFVADPANPTGSWLPFAEIERLARELPPHVLLVLDGAYAEFARGLEAWGDPMALARRSHNVLVTRTFSKLFGLAGLRVGWAYGPQEVVAAMDLIRLPFNVAVPAEAAALAALEDEAFVEASIAHVEARRPVWRRRFLELGLAPLPSGANFVTVGFPPEGPSAAETEAALGREGVIVRGLKGYGLPDHLRVTIGPDTATERFWAAIEAFLSG